jgi:prophage DNA circulation protein
MAAEFDELLVLEFEGVKLPCSKFPYQGGHDSAEHKAHSRPGALQEPTGRQPYTGSCTCPLFNTRELESEFGQLYPLLSERIRGVFERSPIGRLVHPVLGPLVALVSAWSFDGNSDARNGLELTFEWREHNASVAEVIDLADASPEGVAAQADIADAAVAAVAPTAPATRPSIDAGMAVVTSGNARSSELESAFRDMLAFVDDVRANADLASAAASTAQIELERLRARVVDVQRATTASDADVQRFTLPRTMALFEVAAEVYGQVSTTALTQLQAANSISSPLSIPAGTVLRVPPLVLA